MPICLKRNTRILSAICQREFGDEDYIKYLDALPVHETHAGYFSIDKKGKLTDSKLSDKKAGTSDDIDAYDLIMKNKELQLDRDPKRSPVRIIFSHSALREGWDNPNVFQICTLKQSSSEVASVRKSDAVCACASIRMASAWMPMYWAMMFTPSMS